MPEPIEEALGFDISGALQGIGQIDDALTQVTQQFSVGLATALETLTSIGANVPPLAESLDVAGLGPAIDTALANANAVVPVEADTSAAVDQIDQLALGLTETIPIEADTAPAEEQIGQLGLGLTVDVPITADTSEAQTAIDALNTTPVTVDVEADTSQAQDSLDALGTSATKAAGSGGGGQGLAGLEGAVLGIKAASGAAQGEVGGLTEGIAGISASTAGVVAGGVAFTGFLSETIKLAADAQAQQARFNSTFGASAKIVQSIDVGGLKVSLKDLGEQTGTLNADLESSATRVGLLGNAAHAAQPEIAKNASNLLGLAAALSVSNPRLGDAATVADVFSRALATGRTRSLLPWGVSLTAVAIQQEALRENTDKTKDTLTGYDKLVAGLTLALQQQGDTLGTKYSAGIQNAQIQLRSLKTQLEETLVAVGAPLLGPVVESLKALLPVAQQVGLVLGQLGQVTVPLIAGLTPLLTPLAGSLSLVADGLGQVAHVVQGIPAPFIAIAGGLGLATVAFRTIVPAIAAFVETGELALGPAGWVLAGATALGLLGGAMDVFGGHSKDAAISTDALSTAFDSTTTSGTNLTGVLSGLSAALDDYLKHQLAAGTAGNTANDAAAQLGISYGQIKTALTGTDAQFRTFEHDLGGTASQTFQNSKAFSNLFDVIDNGRTTLQANAQIALAAAVANGAVKQSEVDLLAQHKKILTFTADGLIPTGIDYLGILTQLTPKIDATTVAQQKATFANFATSTSAKDLASSIALGSVKLADAQTVATQYGITVEQATTLITRQEQAMVAASIATGRFTQGFLALKPAIASGNITINDAQQVADQLGISFDDAKAAIQSLSTAMDQFVSQGLSALPSAGQAISDFASGIQSAQSNLDSVLSSSASSTSGVDAVARAQESANRAISDGAEKRARTVAAAEQKVRDAQAALDQAEQSSSTHRVAQIASAQRTLETAQAGLVSAQEKAGQAQADAVRSGSRKVSDAQNAANQKSADEAQKVRDAQAALIAAQDPQRVIDAENAQIFRILSFQQNLAVLLRRGRDQVVAQLVAEGPEKGAALASSLVNDDAKAKALDSGLALGQKIREGYAGFLQNPKVKAELSGFAVTLADGSTKTLGEVLRTSGEKAAGSLLNGLTGGFTHATGLTSTAHTGAAVLGSAIDTATAGAKKKGEDAGTAAQTGFTTSFTPETSAATAIAKVPAAIAGGIAPINIAATTAGDAVAARFHPNFAAQILPAMLQVVTSIATGVAQVAPFVGEEGAVLGTAFGQGFAGGLTLAGPDVTFAAGALADEAVAAIRKALGIKSPSSVGVDIGTQFVAGVAQGLSELSPLHQATAALALALIPDIRPALRQIPSLAPAITSAGQQIVSRPVVVAAPASTQPSTPPGKNVNVRVDLHKVDVNPKHLADEIAWTIG